MDSGHWITDIQRRKLTALIFNLSQAAGVTWGGEEKYVQRCLVIKFEFNLSCVYVCAWVCKRMWLSLSLRFASHQRKVVLTAFDSQHLAYDLFKILSLYFLSLSLCHSFPYTFPYPLTHICTRVCGNFAEKLKTLLGSAS